MTTDTTNDPQAAQKAPRLTAAEKLKIAQERAAKANRRLAVLKNKFEIGERARQTQQKCALGGVLFAIAARGEVSDLRVVDYVIRFLTHSTSGSADSNRAVLVGTAFDCNVTSEPIPQDLVSYHQDQDGNDDR
jgi:hypothetical protein